jgi:hypothetical protein
LTTPTLRLLERWFTSPVARLLLLLIYTLSLISVFALIGYDDAKRILYLDIQ